MKSLEIGNKVYYGNDDCVVININDNGTYDLKGIDEYKGVRIEEIKVIPFVDTLELGSGVVNEKGLKGVVKGKAKCFYYVVFENGTSAIYYHEKQKSEKVRSFESDKRSYLKLSK